MSLIIQEIKILLYIKTVIMNKLNLILFLLVFSTLAFSSPEVYFISPKNGEVVNSPVNVKFGLKGYGIAPAGINFPETGLHHLLVNLTELPDLKSSIPADENHIHFGKGQTETLLELKPGEYSFQLLLGDWMHVPHNPPILSEKIKIIVKD